MKQGKKSEKSRTAILEASLELFSSQGYRGTSIREIAEAAGVSTGNVYHHFPDKETIFQTVLGQYWKAIENPDFPFNKALASGTFPDNLEELAVAAREGVRLWRRHVALIYVDVVELSGNHIRKFYSEMASRFERFIVAHGETLSGEIRPGVPVTTAVMLASRVFLQYYAVEILFGVPEQFGKDSDRVMGEIAEILRHGMLKEPGLAAAARPALARASR
ncbi:MAG TPA: TetR/AcrR family transcriptional regulator [Thermoanaerobaculia bacterium]